ncbi:hypothetical protein PIB30_012195 [Stylosanthes scabra]|uniref:F-box domain-containing protein n=1 Tax=Stylosanthes scabra TaxID=79078 RepID=A0ABU6U4U3_9FABA|nr:hypothetical protein [Stylosanthes scabra]
MAAIAPLSEVDASAEAEKIMDGISDLPKAILHNILARLPDKDSARTSVLSKAWRETWCTFPILSICSYQFFRSQDVTVENSHSLIDKVIDYVGRRLLSLRDRGLAIKEFKLMLDYVDNEYMSHHLDLWLKMAIESGCEVLQLCLHRGFLGAEYSQDRFYDLPLSVTVSKSLIKLELTGGIRVDQAFLTHSIMLYSVRILTLCNLIFTRDGIIDHLISHCPLIEVLTVKYCVVYNPLSIGNPQVSRFNKVNSLFLHGLHKLKRANVQGIKEVYIDAPNLEVLQFFHRTSNHPNASFKLNLDGFTNLRWLCLWSWKISDIGDKWFLELFSKLPFLEDLDLRGCSLSERISIMSAQLKVLGLSNCSNVKEVNVDAPNLLSLVYRGKNQPVISFRRTSNELEVKVSLCSLRNCLQNIKPQNILASVSLFIYQSFPIEPMHGAFQVSSIPPTVRHLELGCAPENEALYFPFMNYLFSSCCPKLITFKLSSNKVDRKAFIEFLYEVLMGRKEGKCHCSSSNTKCWWHALKIVKVTCSFKFDENADLKSILDALPKCYSNEKITFMLEL